MSAFTITVSCVSPDGEERRHDVLVAADGSVTTSDHDREPWGVDERVHRHLDPHHQSPHACDWWADEAPAHYSAWLGGQIAVMQVPWSQQIEHDAARWTVQQHNATDASTTRVLSRFLLNPTPAYHFTYDQPINMPRLHRYLALIAEHQKQHRDSILGDDHGTIPLPYLTELMGTASEEQVAAYLDRLVGWHAIPGLLALGLPIDDAAACYHALAADNDPDSVYWYGGVPHTIERALALGVPRERLAAFLQRRAGNGPLMDTPAIRRKIFDATKDVPGMSFAWIAEAVAMLPSSRALTARYGEMLASQPSGDDWTRLLAHDIAADTAIRLLVTGQDPAMWPTGWEYPAVENLADIHARMQEAS